MNSELRWAIEILKTCRQAMGEQTNLILVQRVLPDQAEESRMAQVMSAIDLQMMVTTGGRERTDAEHRALMEAAGFRVTRVVPTQSEMSVVECVPVLQVCHVCEILANPNLSCESKVARQILSMVRLKTLVKTEEGERRTIVTR